MIKIGDLAPEFTLEDSYGQAIALKDLRGKKIVLYFYPKDDTPGCTVEAQGFSQAKADYDALNAVIIGMSKDTVSSHAKFCNKYGLTITLLADPEQKAIDQYDVWHEKQMMGKTYMGIVRTTFLIDEQGVVRHIWPSVTPKGHEQEVLNTLKLM